ncbi:MAG: hypothetical protein IT423_22015 [Pirellulaceae bacterium]|nr:hypothetical protein [Pirellulaceae bacterium]
MSELSPSPEKLSGRFLADWHADASGPAGIAQFCQRNGLSSTQQPTLVFQLICIDLEKNWSTWSEKVQLRMHSVQRADELLDMWKQLPRFQSYAPLFAGPDEIAPFWSELAGHECYCRDRWGDAVGPPYYQHHFQIKTSEYLRRTRRLMRCELESNEEFSQVLFPLRGCNEVGRQRTRDDEGYFHEPKPDGNRIVVANRLEADISRDQLAIQLLSPMVAVIINRSQVNSIRVSPDKVLPIDGRTAVTFPFTIQLPGRRLCCY